MQHRQWAWIAVAGRSPREQGVRAGSGSTTGYHTEVAGPLRLERVESLNGTSCRNVEPRNTTEPKAIPGTKPEIWWTVRRRATERGLSFHHSNGPPLASGTVRH